MTYFEPVNRGFKYGDGFFETIRTVNGAIILLEYHLERIVDALEILEFEVEKECSEQWLADLIAPDKYPNHITRISFYRDGEGTYAPINNYFKTYIERNESTEEFWIPTALDLQAELINAPQSLGKIELYPMPKPLHPLFTIKTLSSAYYVLAAKYKVENGIDHLLLMNENTTILEELSSNLLLVKGDQLFIPERNNGAVVGSCIRYILKQYGFQITELKLSLDQLVDFDQIFLTRSTRGVFRIK